MRVRGLPKLKSGFVFFLPSGADWRPGEAIELPDDLARALIREGYAEELLPGDVGTPGASHTGEILMPEADESEGE